ncbi:MAG: sulfopyruvate decarboxylase subunit beta [Candidatus Thorarchaeota archaeon]
MRVKRFDAIKKIVESLGEELLVCNLGEPSRELFHIKDRNENFYMLGSMGLASSLAFGTALSVANKKVWCIDGDGSILMNLGTLSTIANNNPENLTLIIIDNSAYGSTGDQKTYTYGKTKLEIIAKGAGFNSISVIDKEEDIVKFLKKIGAGCHFVLIKVEPGNANVENVPLHPQEIKKRFRNAISNDK